MSVSSTIDQASATWTPYLPWHRASGLVSPAAAGYFFFVNAITGDGTGGNITSTLQFTAAYALRRAFRILDMTAQVAAGDTPQASEMQYSFIQQGVTQQWGVQNEVSVAITNNASSPLARDARVIRDLTIIPGPQLTSPISFICVWDNNVNTDVYVHRAFIQVLQDPAGLP